MTGSQIYWLLMLDSVKEVCFGFSFLFGIISIAVTVCFIVGLVGTATSPEESKWSGWHKGEYKKFGKIFTPLFYIIVPFTLIFITASNMLPTTKQMATIIVVPKILNNAEVQKIPNNVVELANDWIKELKPENVKEDVKAIVKGGK